MRRMFLREVTVIIAKWVRVASVLLLAACSGCSGGTGQPQSRGSSPLVSPQGDLIDLGEFEEGARIEASFVVKNQSGESLRLRRDVGTSCSCMGATVDKESLAAGELATVQVALTSIGNEGAERIVRTAVHLKETQEDRPLQVLLKYRVRPGWRCTPDRLVLEADDDGRAHGTICVLSMGKPNLQVTSVESTIPGCESRISNLSGAGKKPTEEIAKIEIECRLPAGSGRQEHVITVNSNDSNVPSRKVVAIASAPIPVKIEPRLLQISIPVGGHEPVSTRARIMAPKGSVRLMKATTDCKFAEALLEPIEDELQPGVIGQLIVRTIGEVPARRHVFVIHLAYQLEGSEDTLSVAVPVSMSVGES